MSSTSDIPNGAPPLRRQVSAVPPGRIGAGVRLDDLDSDPYPIYAELRAHEPVAWVPALDLWFVTRWRDVKRVLSDHELFTADMPGSPLSRSLGPNMMHAEGQYHRTIRDVVQVPFRPARINVFAAGGLQQMADDLLNELVGDGGGDLVSAFAEPLSVRVLCHILGLPKGCEPDFREWFAALATGASNFEGDPVKMRSAKAASAAIDRVLEPFIQRRAVAPPQSMIAEMLDPNSGHPLRPGQVEANLKLTVLGGMQEPRDLIGLTILALLHNPDVLVQVYSDPAMIRSVVEEVLRWQSPVGTITRVTRQDLVLEGVELPRGSTVAAVIASANRDEAHWSDPDRFQHQRREGPHLAFGGGPHVCVGASLARAEAEVAVRSLLNRCGDLALAAPGAAEVRGWEFRGPTRLEATWVPAP